jgi:hypothetical protein
MLSIDDFQPITIDDKPVFDKIYKTYPPIHSDYVFTSLFSWMDFANYQYIILEGTIVLFSQIEGEISFRPPIGKSKKNICDQVLALVKGNLTEYSFGMITEDVKEWMEHNYSDLHFQADRGYFDYVYAASDLAELSGSEYGKIRNRINKFKRNSTYHLEEISATNFDDVKEFLKRWCLWKDCESDPMLEYEKRAILTSIDHFFELGLSGLAIRINDAIEVISVFEKMNAETAVIHYEKGSPYYDGIYKLINQETAQKLRRDVTFINRESDMDIPGLRKAKMSYRPHHMVEIFHLC